MEGFEIEFFASAKRGFRIYSDPDHPGEYVFYTMEVDRVWGWIFDRGNIVAGGFESADSLWTNLQKD